MQAICTICNLYQLQIVHIETVVGCYLRILRLYLVAQCYLLILNQEPLPLQMSDVRCRMSECVEKHEKDAFLLFNSLASVLRPLLCQWFEVDVNEKNIAAVKH